MEVGLFTWGFIQCFVVGVLIPVVKRNRNNYWLSSIFIATAFNILFQYLLRFTDLKYRNPELLALPDALDWLLPPLVLIYLQNILGDFFEPKKLRYFIPPLLWMACMLLYMLTNPAYSFDSYIGSAFHAFNLSLLFFWKCSIGYTGYMFFKKRVMYLTKKQRVLIAWPKILLFFLFILCYIALANTLNVLLVDPAYLNDVVREKIRILVGLNYVVFTCSIILITIYFAFKYPKILTGNPIVKQVEEADIMEVEAHRKTLVSLIEDQKIYLNTELNEKKLAEAIGIPTHSLSRLLNEHMGKSFSEYINHYRIEEAKRLLLDKGKDDLTAYAVAVDSGFRSESVFYVNFKKNTGYTPMQFKKNMSSKAV